MNRRSKKKADATLEIRKLATGGWMYNAVCLSTGTASGGWMRFIGSPGFESEERVTSVVLSLLDRRCTRHSHKWSSLP